MLLRMTSDTCGYCADTGRDRAPSTTGNASANHGFALSTSASLYTDGNTGRCDAASAMVFDTSGVDSQRANFTASTLFFEYAETASCQPPMQVALLPPLSDGSVVTPTLPLTFESASLSRRFQTYPQLCPKITLPD